MVNKEVELLYENYQKHSNTKLSQDEFVTLLTFFPAVQVLIADGEIDKEEWIYVQHIAKSMAETYKDEVTNKYELIDLQQTYEANLSYILQNINNWSEKFTYGLKHYLKDMPEVKEIVFDVMYMFADASNDVSKAEKEMIENLKADLDLV
ncbi:MAG: TerB family tellurite resistance protein [Thermoflexibacter sp.]|jgi:tellurite resistance protein|nr:TerB family tellurite resistance protein [Thermoflexibacter sp.]